MSADQADERQGKVTLVVGVAGVLSGLVLQSINAHSFATQPPPQVFADAGSTALQSEIAGLAILGGVILMIVGVVRYTQSGGNGPSVMATAPFERAGAATPHAHATPGENVVGVSGAAFCSSCGERIVGEGRYCASCGTPTAR